MPGHPGGITLTTQSPKSPGGPTMPRRCQLDDLPKPILHLRAPEHKGFAGCLHIALRKVTRGTRGKVDLGCAGDIWCQHPMNVNPVWKKGVVHNKSDVNCQPNNGV